MDPRKAVEWLHDFETVMKEEVSLYFYNDCKSKTPTLLQSDWMQYKFGLDYSLLTGKGHPPLADMLVARATDRVLRSSSSSSASSSSGSMEAADVSTLSTKKKQDQQRQLLEHWALWCLCNESNLVESGLRRDITRHLNAMAKGKFGDKDAPSVREAVKYILGSLKPQKLAAKHVIKLISTPRGQLPLAEWVAKMLTMQKESKRVGIDFSQPSVSGEDELASLQAANSRHRELTHQFFELMLSTKEEQFLASRGLADKSLEELHKALGLDGEDYQTVEQQRLLFHQGHGTKVWQERKNVLAKSFGLQQPKKQQTQPKKQPKQQEEQKLQQPLGPPQPKTQCKECGKFHRGRCNPGIVARNAAAAANAAAARTGGGHNYGTVHPDRQAQVPGGAQPRSRSNSRSRKGKRFNVELPRRNPVPSAETLARGLQSEVTGGSTMYDTLLKTNPVYDVLKRRLVVSAKGHGQVLNILVGADTDSNICVLSRSALRKAKLIPKEEAMSRMDKNFADYVEQAPSSVRTLAGSEKIGAMNFVEVNSPSRHEAGEKVTVIPVFACDGTSLLEGTEGLMSYHVCRKVFGDAFSVPEGIDHPESPFEGEEGC